MKFQIAEKSYAGNWARPKVDLEVSEGEGLVTAVTPWGQRECAKTAAQTIREYYSSALNDPEATSPFARLPTLSPQSNRVRVASLLANDALLQKYNKTVFSSACEVVTLGVFGRQLSWVQVGQPHLLLVRNGAIHPLQVSPDLALDYSNPTPLPGKLIGLDRDIEIETRSLMMKPHDKIVLLSHSVIPNSLFGLQYGETVDEISKLIFETAASAETEIPFWLAVISVNHLD